MLKTSASKQSAIRKVQPAGGKVPLLDLRRGYEPLREEILQAIARVCDSQQFILGDEVKKFEQEAASFLGSEACVACASGTDALWLALVAAGVEAGDSVITTPFSFFASASSIIRAGGRPIFADIDPETLNLSPSSVESCAQTGARVRAILPVHLYGQCADVDSLRGIASELKLALVEDAAQAFGATWRGQRAGNLGIAAAFSFYPTKNLSAFGDAGCVTTNDAKLAARMRSLRTHGSTERYYHDEMGWNCRMDSIQAAVLRVKLKHLEDWNHQRRAHARFYDAHFAAAGLSAAGGPVRLLHTLPQAGHIYHQYVVRVARRDELRAYLAEHGVGTEIYYPVPLHLQKCLAYLGYSAGDLPEAERAAQEVLALPIFPELTEEEQSQVVDSIAAFYS